jgi:hypothetical protein
MRRNFDVTIEQPDYWLAYLSDRDDCANEITAIAPCLLDRLRFSRDACAVLAAADAYRSAHPHHRVVFVAAVTHWLDRVKNITWDDLEVDFDGALADLDRHSPALLIEASPIARAVVASAADRLTIFVVDGGIEDGGDHTEPCREAIVATLERDWPAYIRRVVTPR